MGIAVVVSGVAKVGKPHDGAGLKAISHVQNGSTTVASVSYTLDNVGNRTERVDQQGTHSYGYDNLYRLTSVTYPGPSTTSYTFDAFGNRTSLTDGSGTTNYVYDDADRITSVTPPSPAPAVSYTWDNNGNLTNRGSDTFSWDYEDRMTSATLNSVTTSFAYRGDGLRNSRTDGGVTTSFTWDIAAGLPVVLDDGNQYVYGAGLTAMKQSGSWYYYLADGLGSTMAIVDASGTVQKSYTYDVYGEATATGTLANEFDFAGQQTDATGLQYLRARFFEPGTGTFLSRDVAARSVLGSTNGYGFASCNPVRFTDATGAKPSDGADGDERNRSSREKLCLRLVGDMQERIATMREDREVIEGRGTGRPVSDDAKRGKQRRYRKDQAVLNDLWERFQHLRCGEFVGTGWIPDDFDQLLNGEYPKFDSSSESWWDSLPKPNLEWPKVPDNIWWNRNDWWNGPIPVPAPIPAPY